MKPNYFIIIFMQKIKLRCILNPLDLMDKTVHLTINHKKRKIGIIK